MKRELKKLLVQEYKKYAEDIIRIKGREIRNYQFIESRFCRINDYATAGVLHPIYQGRPVTCWSRLPNPDFDKESYIYIYHAFGQPYMNDIIINVITNEKRPQLIVVRYKSIG